MKKEEAKIDEAQAKSLIAVETTDIEVMLRFNQHIDKIFDYFENRTCGNCHYYTYCSRENGKTKQAMPYFRCSNEDIDADGGWFEPPNKNFGCNKFERKDYD